MIESNVVTPLSSFLFKLAFKNRLTLPVLIAIAFLACNFRWEVEISIQTERIQFQESITPHEMSETNSWNEEFEVDSDLTQTDDEEDDEITV